MTSTAEPIRVNLNQMNLGIKLSRGWILDVEVFEDDLVSLCN